MTMQEKKKLLFRIIIKPNPLQPKTENFHLRWKLISGADRQCDHFEFWINMHVLEVVWEHSLTS